MFLDKELEHINEAKASLSVCCELRRRLIDIETRSVWGAVRGRISNVALGLAVAEQVFYFFRDRKGGSR